ncbi:hypothetical protein SLEP1_g15143 [Rubroshorea leprosula]|uniref:Uncharacterized protein n=1 Tax=Rubroshorea leprosula TaxID=152421 RepID=A0AAV5IU87_9ROSI|nr:hypothetical protein SLEP1_g15143 [Rubroshorea leprosula]
MICVKNPVRLAMVLLMFGSGSTVHGVSTVHGYCS